MKAMTEAATGALGPVIAKLGDLFLSEHMAALEGSRSDMEFIKSELEPLRSHLVTMWDKEDRLDAECKYLMEDARTLSYNLEDAIDFCLAGLQAAAGSSSTSPFEGMRNQVQELVKRCRGKLWNTEATSEVDTPAASSASSPSLPGKKASELVEMDEKKAKLISLVKHNEVVCIRGSAGMGKSTLAGLAYQAVSELFQCSAFVSVSPRQSMRQVLTTITCEVVASAIIQAARDNQRVLTENNNTAPTTEGTGETDDEKCLLKSLRDLLFKSAPDAASTSADNQKKTLIDSISTRFIINKRKENASAQPADDASVDVTEKQNLINIVFKLLGEKRKISDGAPYAGMTDVVDDEQYLSIILSGFLSDQRYLVIVDDVWQCQQWEVIRKSLGKNDRGSRIILTTRANSEVEKCCKDKHAVFEVEGLSMDAAVALSEKKFKQVHTAASEEVICSSIAKVSGCRPLAIICISEAVAKQLSTSAANRFDEALCQALKGFTEIDCMKPLAESLVRGYHCLPLHLKTCLLHCSIYPPNQRFERDDLIRIWMDEGFADQEQAPGYFEELVKLGYISISRAEGTGLSQVAEYEISAVVLAFLRSQTQKHDFVGSSGYFSNIESLYGRRHHRLSVLGSLSAWDVSRLDFSCMRSLVVFGRASLIPFERLSNLRVLLLNEDTRSQEQDVELYNYLDLGDDDLVDLCELHLLRYLKLVGCKITKLPPEIRKLQLLETLDIRGTGVRELPKEIGELTQLKTLNISSTAVTQVPAEIGKLEHLETLDIRGTCVRELSMEIGELKGLKTLNISSTAVTEVPAEIRKLQEMKTLDVSNTNVRELPSHIRTLQNLETLDVSNNRIAKLPTEIRLLQKLKTMHLSGINIKETEIAKEIGELQHLETLDVSNTKVQELPEEIWKLPELKTLNISNTDVQELPWQACLCSKLVRVVAGDKDCPKVVDLHGGALSNYANICEEEKISIILFDRFGSSWEPIDVARFKIPGKHIKLPEFIKKLRDISSLEINLWKLDEEDLKILQEMPELRVLALRVQVLPRTAITSGGFSKLESFFVDCRVPRLSFQSEAMPVLKDLQFKFYAFGATKPEPMGIVDLASLHRVDFRCASEYTTDAPGIREIINQVMKEAKEHRNRITICINTKEIHHEIVPGSTGSSAASVNDDKKPEPTTGNDDIDNENNILVRSSGLPEWIYLQ